MAMFLIAGGCRITGAQPDGDSIRFTPDDPAITNPRALRALLDAGVTVLTLTREDRSLEDAYFSIVAQAKDA